MTNLTSFPVLLTERLTLRQLSVDDRQSIFALRSDSEINKYLAREASKTIEDAIVFINKIKTSNSLYWAVTLSKSNTFVGTTCLFGFSDETDKCEIGYELLTNFQGKGIMQEAINKVIDYAFNTIGVQKIEAILHRDNQRSINLLEKLLFRKSDVIDTTDIDLICYYLKSSNENIK